MRLICILLGIPSLLYAQAVPQPQATPQPLAPGPLLNRAPAFSQWLMSMKSSGTSAASIPDQKTTYDQRTVVRKTGPIRYELTAYSDGRRVQKWCEADLQATIYPGAKEPVVAMASGFARGNVGFTDYSKTDFPGFDWISKKNYTGTRSMLGVSCIVFHSDVDPVSGAVASPSPTPVPNPNAPAVIPDSGDTAYIAADTRLPVLLVTNGSLIFYQFQAAPTVPLVLPPDIQAAFDALKDRQQRAAALPPP